MLNGSMEVLLLNTSMKHERDINQVMASIRLVNPYSQEDGRIAYVYAAGFLASYLASLGREDPWILKRFHQHCLEQARANTTLNSRKNKPQT